MLRYIAGYQVELSIAGPHSDVRGRGIGEVTRESKSSTYEISRDLDTRDKAEKLLARRTGRHSVRLRSKMVVLADACPLLWERPETFYSTITVPFIFG